MNFSSVELAWVPGEQPHETVRDAWHAIEVARDLWALVDPDRSEALRAFQKREGDVLPSEVRLGPPQIAELVSLLDGLEAALASVLDSQKRIPLERVDEVAKLAPSLKLSPRRPANERVYAAEEGLSEVQVLRGFLERAAARGDDVVAS